MTTKELYKLLLSHPDAKIVILLRNTLYNGLKYFSTNLSENVKEGRRNSLVKINILDKKPKRNATYNYFLRFIRKFKKQNKQLVFTHKHLETIIYDTVYNNDTNTLYFALMGQPIQKNIIKPTSEIIEAIEKLPEKDRNLIYNYGYFPSFLRTCGYMSSPISNETLKYFFKDQAEKNVQEMLRLAKKDDFVFRLTHFLQLTYNY